MDILIITVIVLLAVWYMVHRIRAALKEKTSPCSDCDGTTCKHKMRQDCQDGEK